MSILRAIPYRAWLLLIIVATVIALGIHPHDQSDYLLEHSLTAAFLLYLVIIDRSKKISNASATLIFLFLMLHAVGAHYLYSNVPYDRWLRAVTGTDLETLFNFQRNHYDRFVHFCFGVLMVYPMREVLARHFRFGHVSGLVAAVAFLAVFSKLYELGEWMLAELMSEENAEQYNGQQGDVFDPQKDMALALAGSIISACVIGTRFSCNRHRATQPQ